MEAKVQIQIVKGSCSKQVCDTVLPCLIGRSHICNIRLTEPDVSGRHVILQINDAGTLVIQNLSRGTTVVNGEPLPCGNEAAVLSGTAVRLGKNAEFIVTCPETVPEEVDEDATIFFSGKEEKTENTAVAAKKSDGASDTLSFFVEQHGEMTSCTTAEMMTRVASAEDIELLRKKVNNSFLKKIIWGGVAVLIIALALGVWWFLSAFRQETELSYPLTAQGIPDDEIFFPCSELGRHFLCYVPKHYSMKTVKKNNFCAAETKIGSFRNVPLRIECRVLSSQKVLTNSMQKGFETWINETAASKRGWNFGKVSEIKFRGRNSGFPYLSAIYTRKINSEAWFGSVVYCEFRNFQFILLKEIPLKERWRGEALLTREPFFSVSPAMINRYWDVSVPLLDLPLEDMLNRANQMLSRVSPGLWDQVYQLLVSALVKAHKENKLNMTERAERMLEDMRGMQLRWLNSQKIEYMNSMAKGNYKTAQKIRMNCKHVFSDENVQWTHLIRNNFWE